MTILKDRREVKAAKNHACDYCGARISQGENHNITTIVGDGIYDWRSHKHCDELVDGLNMFSLCDPGEGLTSDHFQEIIDDRYLGVCREKIGEVDDWLHRQLQSVAFKTKMHEVLFDLRKNKPNEKT